MTVIQFPAALVDRRPKLSMFKATVISNSEFSRRQHIARLAKAEPRPRRELTAGKKVPQRVHPSGIAVEDTVIHNTYGWAATLSAFAWIGDTAEYALVELDVNGQKKVISVRVRDLRKAEQLAQAGSLQPW